MQPIGQRQQQAVHERAVWLSICAIVLCAAGCRPAKPDSSGIQVELTLQPSPPVVGDAEVSLTLTDADGQPLEGADVRVEGNMNHAGMTPSFANLREAASGQYTGTLRFTMGGDWFLLVQVKTPDGTAIERKIDVKGVSAK